MNLSTLFGLMLKASLFSTGGFGNLPSLHDDLLPRGWATETQFAEALAVGQISPGPNGLWVISLGYLVHGLPGALAALVAITLPPLLVIQVDRLYGRIQHHPAVEGFVRGLSIAVVGIFAWVMTQLLHAIGLGAETLAITAAATALGFTRRVPIAAILALAALAGIALQ